MIERRRIFGELSNLTDRALAQLTGAGRDPVVLDRLFRSAVARERLRLEKDLPVLATLGANAPFIGLFGTVLGIIRAFAALSNSAGGADTVMAGIAQALYATAAGLFVAIPAVVAYNKFSNTLRSRIVEAEAARDSFVAERLQGN